MNREQIKLLKKHYKKGARVKLINLSDNFSKFKAGEVGTIKKVDGMGQIHVNWDNGLQLALIYALDDFVVIS